MEPSEKEEVRARTDIVALVSQYTTLRQNGRSYKGLCPFHQEKTPSFTVNPELGRWHCFGACSTGGDVFTFLMRAESLTFLEAAERLAERAGVTLTRAGGRGLDREAANQARDERDRLVTANAQALRFFRESFGRAKMAQEYALKRGLAHETQQAWGVGFAPGGFGDDGWGALARYLKQSGIHLADAEVAGLVFRSRSVESAFIDKFWGRLIFPIHDVQERVVGFGGRLIMPAENAPKYLNSPETPVFSKSRILYGLNRARKTIQAENRAVVVEGYLDVVAAHQAGFTNVVATLGTSLTEEHVRLLHRYAKNVVLSFDSDEAGVRAALRAAALLESADPTATLRILALPPGDDPDSLLARGDAAAFRRAIDQAVTVPEFRLRALRARADLSGDAGKIAFLREALPIVADVRSVLERDLLLRRLAAYHPAFATGGTRAEESLRAELDDYLSRRPVVGSGGRGEILLPPEGGGRGGPTVFRRAAALESGDGDEFPPTPSEPPPVSASRHNGAAAPPAARGGATARAEQMLVCALLSPEWAPLVQNRLRPDLFCDPVNARLVEALLPLIEGHVTPAESLAALTDSALADRASDLLLGDNGEPLGEQAISDSLRLLVRSSQALTLHKIRAETHDRPEGMPADNDELLRRWQDTARQIKGGSTEDDAEASRDEE